MPQNGERHVYSTGMRAATASCSNKILEARLSPWSRLISTPARELSKQVCIPVGCYLSCEGSRRIRRL